MANDATINAPVTDPVSAIDVGTVHVYSIEKQVIVELIYKRASGAVAYTTTHRFDVHGAGTVEDPTVDDYTPCAAAFLQAAPKKKLLNHMVAKGRISGVTVANGT